MCELFFCATLCYALLFAVPVLIALREACGVNLRGGWDLLNADMSTEEEEALVLEGVAFKDGNVIKVSLGRCEELQSSLPA
jgi:hypothetical protein